MTKCPIEITDQANLIKALTSESWDSPQELMQMAGCGIGVKLTTFPSLPKEGDGR